MQPFAYSIKVNWSDDPEFTVYESIYDLISAFSSKFYLSPYQATLKSSNLEITAYYASPQSQKEILLTSLVEKIELSQKDIDDIESNIEALILKQEQWDKKWMETHPGESPPRLSGIYVVSRKDKQKYIDYEISNKSYKWKTDLTTIDNVTE